MQLSRILIFATLFKILSVLIDKAKSLSGMSSLSRKQPKKNPISAKCVNVLRSQ